ncbi:HpcH/HpaI aldolase family protein [Halococcus hamelinensis]|uniref:HpcH/HpaI aldolase n=1 Tax=Halococcus hamelinensis 100A6 TaxID=1132509 RepID=M0LWW9_9EURY|nr:aldolase/citrate lyase family protein [Halococcus hamelinensis]EMA38057.1 HpcH/HpaI aldolase [Halococcus hamelinensis 100A6]
MEQQNGFRRTIENGDVAFGARASTFSPTVIEVFGELGFDFVWLDFEHMGPSPYDSRVFEDLTRAAEAGGTELFVRLPSGDPALIRKVLDAGVRTLLVPRVDTAEEVREAVEATRFVYDGEPGERGMASGRARSWGSSDAYVRTEDEEVCIGAMVEKTGAVESIEEILSVPELGFVFVGPSDLSVQLGHPTDKTHPEVLETIEGIETAARSAGVPMGKIANDPAAIEDATEAGYRIVRMGGDLASIRTTLRDRLAAVERQ